MDEGGIRFLPYPHLGIENPALFFTAGAIVLAELRKVAKESEVKPNGSGSSQ